MLAATQTHMDTQRCSLSPPTTLFFFFYLSLTSQSHAWTQEGSTPSLLSVGVGGPAGGGPRRRHGFRAQEEKAPISQQATQLCSAGPLFPRCTVENPYSPLARIHYKSFEQGQQTLQGPTFDSLQNKRQQHLMIAAVLRSSSVWFVLLFQVGTQQFVSQILTRTIHICICHINLCLRSKLIMVFRPAQDIVHMF